MSLLPTLERFFTERALLARSDLVLVAFSAGPDSTALLAGLADLAARRGFALRAAHLDHALDPDSGRRAAAAHEIAAALDVPLTVARREVERQRGRGESREAAGRRVRYAFLEETRRAAGARYLAVAHHRDDQVETVLLRLLYGSGPAGLAGMPARRGALVRPLLELPRAALAAAVARTGIEPVADPSNRDRAAPRNRLRLDLLPPLERRDPRLRDRVIALAAAARGARRAIDRRLASLLAPRGVAGGAAVTRAALAALPDPLWPYALALLHRRAGAAYPPPARAAADLRRQLRTARRPGCDCGRGWRWEGDRETLALRRRRPPTAPFAYTLRVPGDLELPELALRLRLSRGETAPWMFEGSRRKAGLALPVRPGDEVTVRNRRPGDRIRPLGCAYPRRLKELLIDRRVPRPERDRIPLLCVGGRVAWVPGVTIAEEFRVTGSGPAWVAEIESR